MAEGNLLSSLIIKLGLDTSEFDQGLSNAAETAAKAGGAAQTASAEAARNADNAAANIGRGTDEAKSKVSALQSKMREADAQFTSLGQKWGSAIKSFALQIAGPITAAFAVWKGVTGYASQVAQVAQETGAYNAQMDEWRKKQAMLARVTREDIELYKKSREAITRFQIALGDVTAKVSRSFSPAIKAGIEILEKLTKWVEGHKDDLTRFFKVAAVTITAIFLPALARMAAALMMNPLTWIVAAIGALILIIDDFVTYLHGGTTALGDFWSMFGTSEELAETFGGVLEWIGGLLETLKGHLPQIIAGVGGVLAVLGGFALVGKTVSGVVGLFQSMAGMFGTLISVARTFFAVIMANPIVIAIAAAVAMIGTLVTAFIKGGGTISGMFEVLRGWLADLVGDLGGFGTAVLAAFDLVSGGIMKAIDILSELPQIVSSAFSAFTSWISSLVSGFDGFGAAAQAAFELVAGGIMKALELLGSLPQIIADAAAAVATWLASLPDRFLSVFSSIAAGVQSIFTALWDWLCSLLNPAKLLNKVTDAAKSAVNKVKSWLGFGDDEDEEKKAPAPEPEQPRQNVQQQALPQPQQPAFFNPAAQAADAVQPAKSNGFLQAVDNLPQTSPGGQTPTQAIQNSVNNQTTNNDNRKTENVSNVTQNNNITINTGADPQAVNQGLNSALAMQNDKLQRQAMAVENGVRM